MARWDLPLFRSINQWPDALEPFFLFLSDATKIWPGRILLLATLVWFLSRPKLRVPALLALVAVPISNEACDILKATLQDPRPCAELADVVLRTKLLTSFGTASAHSANMMAVATIFLLAHRKWGYFWLAVAIFTGLSRIYVGVHYPQQVLLGWLVGANAALLTHWVYRKVCDARSAKESSTEP